MFEKKSKQDTMFPEDVKREIIRAIIDNDFDVNEKQNKMYVSVNDKRLILLDEDVRMLVNCSISERVKIKEGMTAKDFCIQKGTSFGYKIYDSSKHPEYVTGAYIRDTKQHGIYFITQKKDLFRFIMVNYGEDFGDSIAKISLISPQGEYVEDAHIAKGYDTDSTYRTLGFYVVETNLLNNFEYVCECYSIAKERWKRLIYDDSEYGIYQSSIRYYKQRNCDEIVRALQFLHSRCV